MKKLSNPAKSVIIIFCVLLIVPFYESKRVEILSVGMENKALRNLALSYASNSEKIKSVLGLSGFFQRDENFQLIFKKSPTIFEYPAQISQISSPLPLQTPSSTPALPTSTLPQILKIEPPYNILIAGDSFVVEGFGPALEKELILYKDTNVYRKGLYSTGISRPDYFNWNEEMKRLINLHNPNVAVVVFGLNDAQDQRTVDKKIIHYGTSEWNVEYGKRVDEILDILTENKISVYWVGLPNARSQSFSDKMEKLNLIFEAECQKYSDCVYFSTWELLLDSNGQYSDYLPDGTGKMQPVRRTDGIHPKGYGTEILVGALISQMKEKIDLQLIEQK
jgi:hypothetical protein